jgi:hypothetical protein
MKKVYIKEALNSYEKIINGQIEQIWFDILEMVEEQNKINNDHFKYTYQLFMCEEIGNIIVQLNNKKIDTIIIKDFDNGEIIYNNLKKYCKKHNFNLINYNYYG